MYKAEGARRPPERSNVCLKPTGLQLTPHLLLATGRAISNLARNWKYCSSFCWVKPVPTSSSCNENQTCHQRGSEP